MILSCKKSACAFCGLQQGLCYCPVEDGPRQAAAVWTGEVESIFTVHMMEHCKVLPRVSVPWRPSEALDTILGQLQWVSVLEW